MEPFVTLQLRGASDPLYVPLGAGPATVQDGGAEFEEGRRPKADAVTLFTGNKLLKVDVPVLLDVYKLAKNHPEQGWDLWNGPTPRGDAVPHPIPTVQQILNLCIADGTGRPPNFIARGPIPFTGSRFTMELPEWGEGLRDTRGFLVRQYLTLHLVEWNDPTSIKFKRTRQHVGVGWTGAGGGTTAPSGSVVLARSESLIELAGEMFGDAALATAIGKLNDIRDIRKKLPAGTRIKLPDESPKSSKREN